MMIFFNSSPLSTQSSTQLLLPSLFLAYSPSWNPWVATLNKSLYSVYCFPSLTNNIFIYHHLLWLNSVAFTGHWTFFLFLISYSFCHGAFWGLLFHQIKFFLHRNLQIQICPEISEYHSFLKYFLPNLICSILVWLSSVSHALWQRTALV